MKGPVDKPGKAILVHFFHVFMTYRLCFLQFCFHNNIILGSDVVSTGETLQLKDLSYKELAGTYMCTVTGIGGQSSGNGTLEVYCKYNSTVLYNKNVVVFVKYKVT